MPFSFWGGRQIEISVSDPVVVEGTSLAFTISLNRAATTNLSVDYATADNSALAGTHYLAASGQAVINAGNTST